MNFCGTLGTNVVKIVPISGRLRAAVRNLARLFARNGTSLPARSSRTNETPPEVPTPGIAGGEKLKTVPSGRFLSSWFKRALMAWYCSLRLLRSSQGFRDTQKNALYEVRT